ncbi:E3 SUMO-transferase plil [Hyphodiscus hymeniophilus]|uniref:E3 SUMO-transferase plil n=1 Tax=Hyphodiscus hymeniophilus TaxID=353542 RepID=A0A9P7AWI0_9HELO|nr:E3 SUMO-transferase plil [Hyphodiscus hymeniophilus]
MVGSQEVDQLVRRVKGAGMVNKILHGICQAEGMSKVGVKADLQTRIIEMRLNQTFQLTLMLTAGIQLYNRNRDDRSFSRLKSMIEDPTAIPQPGFQSNAAMATSSSPLPAGPASYASYHAPGPSPAVRGQGYLDFKPSPFYKFHEQVGETKTLEVMANHRHASSVTLRTNQSAALAKVVTDPSYRVMVFCAGDNHGRQDIAFPHQSEVKVNTGDVKANLRGLKNKPGSTRPVDITKELRLKVPNYNNTVELTYALTTKKFYLAIWVVKLVPVEELVKKLESGRRIAKETVLNDMASKARDADIVATASVLSLKCPLSTLRIDLPCRSISCRHNQCFDATSYLQLQEQGPTWLCPICNNSAPFENLAVDEYVRDILRTTSKHIDQVTVQPSGKWELYARPEPTSNSNGIASSDDDDDLVEITKSGDSIRMSTPRTYATPVPAAVAAASRMREASTSSSATRQGSTSAKRPAPVIDLTSSGDEDDEPIARQPKRQFTTNSLSGLSASSTPAYRPALPTSNGYSPRT